MATILRRWRQRRHVTDKIRTQEKKLWDLDFFRTQLKNEREGIRVEYDRIKETVDAAELRLKTAKETGDLNDEGRANLQKLLDRFRPDLEQLRSQMAQIDSQVEGVDEEVPDPETQGKMQKIHKQGVNDTIEQHHSLITLLKEYRSTI